MHPDIYGDPHEFAERPQRRTGGVVLADHCDLAQAAPGAMTGVGVTTYRVEELDCATEGNELRTVLIRLPGVRSLEFELVARRVRVRVRHDLADPTPIEGAIRELGMRPKLIVESSGGRPKRSLSNRAIATTAAAGVLAIGSEIAVIAGADEQSVLVGAMALAAIALGGRDTLRKGFQALRSLRMTMSLLMSVAVVGAIAIGQWPEAAVVIWLFGVAELIEALSLERARHAIRSLIELAPEVATVQRGDAWIEVPTVDVSLDSVILVKPGSRVALDGRVAAGSSSVDQAPITGSDQQPAMVDGETIDA